MAIYVLKMKGDDLASPDPRYPSEIIEADGYRRFAKVVVFLRDGRDWFDVPTERLAEIRKFTNRIDAEAYLAGRPLAPGNAEGDTRRRRWVPPADLPPLVPGPGKAPSRKLQPTPLSAVLDLSNEPIRVSPTGPRVESVEVHTKPNDDA